MRKIITLFLVSTILFACTNNSTSGTQTDKDTTKKDTSYKDTSNPNAPGATNAQY
jgi:hypothetical protein